MEDKPLPNSDFEKLLRQQLQQADATPDDGSWAQIAAQQRRRNGWLQIRYYLPYAAAAAFLLAVALAGWWQHRQSDLPLAGRPGSNSRNAPAYPSEIAPNAPVADAGPTRETARFFSPAARMLPLSASPAGAVNVNTVPSTSVRFQVETGLSYQSPISGTSITIPANSLVNAGGEPVQGEVELQFREYRSIPDFLASGIPMHYGDERGSFFFNSGGMFEVRVNQGGTPLQMAPGQRYDVLFSPTDKLTGANLYYFDEAGGAWKYQPDPAFNGGSTALPALVSESEAARNNTDKSGPECLPEIPEILPKDPVTSLKQAVLLGYDLAAGKVKMPMWFCKNPELNNEQLLNGLERGLIRMVRDRDRVEQMFPEDVDNVFTELKAFKDCYFVRTGDSAELKLTQKLLAEQYWHRIAIFRDKGSSCHITLYGEKGFVDFYANLTGSAGNRQFDAVKVMNEYVRLREERQQNFEKLVVSLRDFLFMASIFQTEAEWCKTAPDWLAYFEQNHPLMLKRYEALLKAGIGADNAAAQATWKAWRSRLRNLHFDRMEQRTTNVSAGKMLQYALQLTNFGLYNCDQILRLTYDREIGYILAAFQTPDGRRVVPAMVAVLERKSRLFFTLPSANQMLRMPGRAFDFLVSDNTGRFYHLPAADYANTDFKGLNSKTFRVEDITDKARTPREWANLLDL